MLLETFYEDRIISLCTGTQKRIRKHYGLRTDNYYILEPTVTDKVHCCCFLCLMGFPYKKLFPLQVNLQIRVFKDQNSVFPTDIQHYLHY